MSDNEDFDQGDSGSADTTPVQCGSIKKGGYCMLKGNPCKVTDYSTAKPGKHGAAKATIVGIDIFTNKKVEDTAPTGATVRVPNVTKTEYEVADIDEEGFVSLILEDGSLKQDLKLPKDEDLNAELQKMWDERGDAAVHFTMIAACGQQKLIAGRKKEWSSIPIHHHPISSPLQASSIHSI